MRPMPPSCAVDYTSDHHTSHHPRTCHTSAALEQRRSEASETSVAARTRNCWLTSLSMTSMPLSASAVAMPEPVRECTSTYGKSQPTTPLRPSGRAAGGSGTLRPTAGDRRTHEPSADDADLLELSGLDAAVGDPLQVCGVALGEEHMDEALRHVAGHALLRDDKEEGEQPRDQLGALSSWGHREKKHNGVTSGRARGALCSRALKTSCSLRMPAMPPLTRPSCSDEGGARRRDSGACDLLLPVQRSHKQAQRNTRGWVAWRCAPRYSRGRGADAA